MRAAAPRHDLDLSIVPDVSPSMRAHGRPPQPPTLRHWNALVEAPERRQFGRVEGADLAAIRQRWLAVLNRLPLT